MALKRLLLGMVVLSVIFVNNASSQFDLTQANQDGVLLLDALGRIFSATAESDEIGPYVFKELEATSNKLQFPFPVAKDIEFVGNPDGSPKGAYALDALGGQFSLTLDATVGFISSPYEVGEMHPDFSTIPYFGWDVAKDLEIAPDWRDVTYGYRGYFVLDADGVVHPVGDTNLPTYVMKNLDTGELEAVETLFPGTIDVSGSDISAEMLLNNGPVNYAINRLYSSDQNVKSVTPIFTYFGLGSDIARDLEISAEYVQITAPSADDPDVIENRTVAMTNGYYILDGYGAVHSNRLALDFDVDNNGEILYSDTLEDDFGKPINNVVLAAPWDGDRSDLPYFGGDFAVDIELTPSGKGFYLLDSYGSVFAVGDAKLSFPPKQDASGNLVQSNSVPPFFGIPIARDLSVTSNKENTTLGLTENKLPVGLLVLTGYGALYEAGISETYDITYKGNDGEPISSYSDTFRSVEVAPVWLPADPAKEAFNVGSVSTVSDEFVVGSDLYSDSIAPNFRNVTAAFSTITESYTPVTGSN